MSRGVDVRTQDRRLSTAPWPAWIVASVTAAAERREMSRAENRHGLNRIGARATLTVEARHFPTAFDLAGMDI